MNFTDPLILIKDSFEKWYNSTVSKEHPVSIAINYRDTQEFTIKAYHTATIEMSAIGIVDNKSCITPLLKLQENYNHGVTSEKEARDSMIKKLLQKLYSYR